MNREPSGKIQRAAAWGESAFREVYSRYIKPVRSYIFRRVRNYHDAEDLAAHVFAQALRHVDPERVTTEQLEAWLFTSARNASANHARARKFRATVSIEELAVPAEDSDPGNAILEEEDLARLVDAIRRLPEEQRRAVVLRFFDQLSHSEIAQLLGRTEGSARVLLHRTLSGLREEVS